VAQWQIDFAVSSSSGQDRPDHTTRADKIV